MECSICQTYTASLNNLRKHIKSKHPKEDVDKLAPTLKSQKVYNFECVLCLKHFSNHYKLKSHIKLNHGQTEPLKTNIILHCSFQEFLVWKAELERETTTFFKKRAHVVKGDKVFHYFICHRSGTFVSRGLGIRPFKKEDSCKINALCPAKITVAVSNAQVKTTLYPHHEGHQFKLANEDLLKKVANNVKEKVESIDFQTGYLQIVEEIVGTEDINNTNCIIEEDVTHNISIESNVQEEVVDCESDSSIDAENFEHHASRPNIDTANMEYSGEEKNLAKEVFREEFIALLDSADTHEEMTIIKEGIQEIGATLILSRCQKRTLARATVKREADSHVDFTKLSNIPKRLRGSEESKLAKPESGSSTGTILSIFNIKQT